MLLIYTLGEEFPFFLFHQKDFKMTTMVIYNENVLESFMAAACIASIMPVTVSECKSVMSLDYDLYVWIGVVPTYQYFPSEPIETVNKAIHISICNVEPKSDKTNWVKSTKFVYGSEDSASLASEVQSYGARNLVERSLMFFNKSPVEFIGVIDMIDQFYLVNAPLENLEMTALNAKEALHCLKGRESYSFIPYSTDSASDAEEAYINLVDNAREALKHRSVFTRTSTTTIDPKAKKIYTFFEHQHWWFIQRRLSWQGLCYRNITVSLTGTIMLSDVKFTEDFKHLQPVVMH